jgi:hypothetical protein
MRHVGCQAVYSETTSGPRRAEITPQASAESIRFSFSIVHTDIESSYES